MTSRADLVRPLALMPHNVGQNPFLSDLAQEYKKVGFDVVLGRDNLTYGACQPNIVHIHWPEEHLNWGVDPRTPEARSAAFLRRLDEYKDAGALIVWQVHNLHPHEVESAALEVATYQGLLDRCDLVVHHCPASMELLRKHYSVRPEQKSVVTPHGNYLSYPNSSSRDEARRRLGLPLDGLVFLHFGAIRAYKGLDLLLDAFSATRVRAKCLLVAGRYAALRQEGRWLDRIRLSLLKRTSKTVRLDLRMIPDDEVHFYFNAADIVVLSHREGLNSGVAVLGMSFSRVVVGPDCGCIPHVLGAGENVIYESGNVKALASAMEQAATMDYSSAGQRNRSVVEHWKWSATVAAIADHLPRAATRPA